MSSQVWCARPRVMGVLNVSPDSFFNPAKARDDVIQRAAAMIEAGADILDVGGIATNPNTALGETTLAMEMDRVLPALEALTQRFDVPLSVDTSRVEVISAAVSLGVAMINDQQALAAPGASALLAEHPDVLVCLMHTFSPERLTQAKLPAPSVMLATVLAALKQSAEAAVTAGIDPGRILIDPGFGQGHFGKTCDENYYLLAHLAQFSKLGYPVLVGWSRKSMIGDVLGVPVDERLSGSLAAATIALMAGAAVIRVHDVKESVAVSKIVSAVLAQRGEQDG